MEVSRSIWFWTTLDLVGRPLAIDLTTMPWPQLAPWASRSAVPQPPPAQETVSAPGSVHRAPRTTVERGLRRCVEL
jgi:hypothetical protein